jgi:hypothetical protein
MESTLVPMPHNTRVLVVANSKSISILEYIDSILIPFKKGVPILPLLELILPPTPPPHLRKLVNMDILPVDYTVMICVRYRIIKIRIRQEKR